MIKSNIGTRAILGAMLLLSYPLAGTLSAQSINIPAITWTQRSDWINVMTDPNVSPHAAGNGTTDDTAALQSALNFAMTTGNRYVGKKTVYLPPGTYKISSTLTLEGLTGASIIGCGANTTISWAGSSGQPMFWSQGNTRCRFIGITWNGNSIASCAYLVESIDLYESRMRHENEAFKNFVVSGTYSAGQTVPAAGIIGGIRDETTPSAETMIWNCLFYNCTNGVVVGYQEYNNYMWLIDGCEFENCGVGVAGDDGKFTITDSHFAGSTVADCSGGVTGRVRRCTSIGSYGFYLEGGPSGATSNGVIQDCWIDGWTGNQGAMRFGLRGPDNVFDCVFTHPPAGATGPIQLTNSALDLVASNN